MILDRSGTKSLLVVAGGGGGAIGTTGGGGGVGVGPNGTAGGGLSNPMVLTAGSAGGGGFEFDGHDQNTVFGLWAEGGKAGTLAGGGAGGSMGISSGTEGGFGFGGGGEGHGGGGGGGGYRGGDGGYQDRGTGGSSYVDASGTMVVRLDGADGGGSSADGSVTISAPGVECALLLGSQPAHLPLGSGDDLLVGNVIASWPVTIPTVPVLMIPNDQRLVGFQLYYQVVMLNPVAFPLDPLQLSNGLKAIIGGTTLRYGEGSGLDLWAAMPALPGGAFQPSFRIAR